MKTITHIFYKCELCDEEYRTKKEALACEEKPITEDKGVKVGDIVLITDGESTGKKAKVTSKWIYNRSWGHYAWKRYWHTVGLSADIVGGYMSRQLTFDSYEKR